MLKTNCTLYAQYLQSNLVRQDLPLSRLSWA